MWYQVKRGKVVRGLNQWITRKQDREHGLTVIEVIVAITLVGLVSTAAISFFISGVSSVSESQRKQVAVTLANGAIEQARSVAPTAINAAGTSGLVKGRSQTAVQAVWDEVTALNADDTSDMRIVWDPESGLTEANQWVPLRTTNRVDSQNFEITTLIGTCHRPKLATTNESECTRDAVVAPLTENIQLYRVRVIVRWAENEVATPKTYSLTTLIDPSIDAIWNTVLKPFAYDDEIIVSAGDPTGYYAIVANDQVDYNETGSVSPIVDLTQPALSRAVVGSGDQIGGILYTPPADLNKAGSETFTYAVRGTSMEKSQPATVTARILPKPFDDAIKVEPGTNPVLNAKMLVNDYGTQNISSSRKVSIVLASNPTVDLFSTGDIPESTRAARAASEAALASMGVSIDAAGDVRFDAPEFGLVDPVTFYYYLVDEVRTGAGERYQSRLPSRVVIDASEDDPIADDITIEIPIVTGAGDLLTNLNWQDETGNPGRYQIRITDTNIGDGAQGRLSIDGADYNKVDHNFGKVVHYMQQGNSPEIAWFKYIVVSPSGMESEEKTITLHVIPVANNDSYTVTRNQSKELEIVANDGATDATTRIVNVSAISGSGITCAQFAAGAIMADNGKVIFPAQSRTGTCTFTYSLESKLYPELKAKQPATVTVVITR